MSTNPTSMRFPFEAEIAKLPPEVQRAHRFAFNGILDLNQAIAALKQQVDEKTSQTTTITSTGGTSSSSETIITTPSTIGFVNNQTGVTSYTTQQSDYGALILLSDSSPIAVTLTDASIITLPWYTSFLNLGTGTATLTPETGTINNLASLTLPPNGYVTISFDGANFWLGPPPVIVTRGGTILTPTGAVNVVVWYAPFSCTVTNVLGYVDGATGSVVNARRNGTLTLLVSNLTLGTADVWTDGGAVQNVAISAGDKLEIMVISVAGAPTQIAVEIQLTRP